MTNKSLVFIYVENGIKYFVEGKVSQMTQNFHFLNEYFGATVFDKNEFVVSSSKTINQDYFVFLLRMIKSWKKHFI